MVVMMVWVPLDMVVVMDRMTGASLRYARWSSVDWI